MAREEIEREDLLREATALVERIELRVDSITGTVIVGFRRDGSVSLYFDGDPVYQFNTRQELRRAFDDGALLKASSGQLVRMERVRTEHETQLVSRPLAAAELTALLGKMLGRLAALRNAFHTVGFEIVGQVPSDADLVDRIRRWLAELPSQPIIAQAPGLRG